jgi:SAM-dependent methyltransferase
MRPEAKNKTADLAADFERLPYPSLPFAYTQPAHLAALARLYGVSAPAAEAAKVLELGCASGGNIIPLAARFPKAQFVGLDLSARHIDDGCRRLAALGLKNIELRQGDLNRTEFEPHSFDYIICHGVFSWVPAAVQDSILRICRSALTSDGLAVISYNVLPGWHLRSIVRDLCQRYSTLGAGPQERVAQARRVLVEIAQLTSETAPYGLFLREESKRLEQLPAAYILGEFLSPDNDPKHFSEFVEQANRHRLAFLCEADLGASIAEAMFPATAERIKALAGSDRLAEEAFKDMISGRPFRRSLLLRQERQASIALPPSPARLHDLHVAGRFTPEPDASVFAFKDPRGRMVKTSDPIVANALARLGDVFPSTLSFAELAHLHRGGDNSGSAADGMRLSKALFALVIAGQLGVSTIPLRAGKADCSHPKVWPLARLEASSGQPWLTSLAHEALPRQGLPAGLLKRLDGNSSYEDLLADVTADIRNGTLPLLVPGSEEGIKEAARNYLQRCLFQLARCALLEP